MSVKIGPVYAGILYFAPTVTRQPPHIPVPSIIIGFNETMVFIL